MSDQEKGVEEFKLQFMGLLGPAKVFSQGGSMRLTLPRSMVRKHKLDIKVSKDSPVYYFVVETDKGFLLVPIEKALNPRTLIEALRFVDLSSFDTEDLEALMQESLNGV